MKIGGDHMRLIDADDLKKTWYKEHNIEPGESGAMFVGNNELPKFIDRARTIDAVPVVLCKDCRWWTKQEKSIQGRCALNGTYPTGGWYCANGRKDDEID